MSIAVLIPCYNEALTIKDVVKEFQSVLPQAKIYVYDNNSSDKTGIEAREAGAIVRLEPIQGKGAVVRRMFADIEADVYVMVDGDHTYDAQAASYLIQYLYDCQLDMVIGTRVPQDGAYRPGHAFGNKLFNTLLKVLFKSHFKDIFSGYRVFSKRFVKSFPSVSAGFDIETEITIHALELGLPVAELPTNYDARPEGSESKLHTYRDGLKILLRIVRLFKLERPFAFFGGLSLFFAFVACLLFAPVLTTYLKIGLVPRLPTAVLCASLMLLSIILLACGLVLDSVTHTRTVLKRLHYLSLEAPQNKDSPL